MAAALEGYLDYLRGCGIVFALSPRLVRGADHDGPLVRDPAPVRPIELPGLPPFVEHRAPEQGLAADHATFLLARTLLREELLTPGVRFWDIGCGTCVLAAAAGLAGAVEIAGTDVLPRAIALGRRTLSEAGVDADLFAGSLLDPIPAARRADLVAANLPHKPVPPGLRLCVGQNGGAEGDAVHGAFLAQARRRLEPGTRLVFFLHSLPHPDLLGTYAACCDLRILAWRRRFFAPGEYGPLQDHFLQRAREGTSYVGRDAGRPYLVACIWEAVLKR